MNLKTVVRSQGNNAALKDGTIKPGAFTLEFEEVPVLIDAFRRMVRGLEYDICEMAFATYLCAREHGVPFTGIPVFVMRGFHHGAVVHNTRSGIRTPTDLEGRKVGVNRGYTVTTGVWARGILQDEYGVDLSRVTWMLSGDEHVAEYRPPPNVEPIAQGKDMGRMLDTGELAAAIAFPVGDPVDHPHLAPLIPDPTEAAFESLETRGLYPINHLIVVRDELLEDHPDLAASLFHGFAKAKRRYIARLREGAVHDPSSVDRLYARVMEVIGDPLPYGIEPNRPMIDALIGHALTQQVITVPVKAEDIFAAGTLELAG